MSTPPSSDETLFAAALEHSPAERAAFLDRACAGDPARRARLESLLRAHTAAEGFLESSPDALATATAVTTPLSPPGEKPGDVIGLPAVGLAKVGRYKLLQKIGEGGCGTVYVAEQEEPVIRRVALKVIKLGMDTKEVIARFEAERQALALMDHPHIARVFDAGATDSGRPFFVMELVRGVPITKFCDEQNLPTSARLELFTQVCHAVQHAHQKGIIHRDLKPSNILVTLHDGKPVPKVIDFGIAKATQGRLTDATLFTAFEQFIGTPAYMSPEQAELSGLDIDTRSDIYSLGVLLYELLTGRTPFEAKSLLSAGLDEIRRIIREVEPPRPSTRLSTLTEVDRLTLARQRGIAPGQLANLLRGDLDWIVMRCLEKDRIRRYESSSALAADIGRHLAHEPVYARPPSTAYRLQKLVRRNRVGVLTATAFALLLVVGTIVSTSLAVRATRAEGLASARLDAEQVARRAAESQRLRAEQLRAVSEEQNKQITQHLYAARMKAGFEAWKDGDLAGALVALAAFETPRQGQPDLRGFEWRHLWQLCHDEVLGLPLRGSPVRAVAWSPDGRQIATADDTSTVQLWDSATGTERRSLAVASGRLATVAFSPDGALLATGGEDATVRLWDVATGVAVATLGKLPTAVGTLAISRDGRWLAAANTRIPAGTGTPWTRLGTSAALPARIMIWDLRSRREVANFQAHSSGIQCVAIAPDGESLASASLDGRIRLWEISSGRLKQTLAERNRVPMFSVAFSPDGGLLAAGGGNPYQKESFLRLWHLQGRANETALVAHRGPVLAVAFTRPGQLISAGADQITRVWDVPAGRMLREIRGHAGGVSSLAPDPAGASVVTASWDKTVKVWSLAEAASTSTLAEGGYNFSFAYHPTGEVLAGGGAGVALLDPRTGRVLRTLPGLTATDYYVAFSPNGRLLACAGSDRVVTLWDSQTWKRLATLTGHEDKVRSFAFSPDGRLLATGGFMKDRTVRLWDVAHQREHLVIRAPTSSVESLGFAPDGQTLIASSFAEVIFWDMAAGRVRDHWVEKDALVKLSTDGKLLVVSRPDGVTLMDAGTKAIKWKSAAHHDWIWMTAFAPDNRTLATSSWDGSVKFWNVATGEELWRHQASGVCWGIDFSPSGEHFVMGSGSAQKGDRWLLHAPQPIKVSHRP